MDPLFQDDRISAYLDGQLPPDERTQFEDEMARNSELRQVVEELRGLHDSLQELPRHRLNDDFAQHILRRAERAMLSDPHAVSSGASGADGSGAEDGHVIAGSTDHSISDNLRSRRPWIWAAVVVAAAIALMVFNPPPKKPAEVAQTDAARAPRAAAENVENKSVRSLPEGTLSAPADSDAVKRSVIAQAHSEKFDPTAATGGDEWLRDRSHDVTDNRATTGPTTFGGAGNFRAAEKDAVHAANPEAAAEPTPVENPVVSNSSGNANPDVRSLTTTGGGTAGLGPAPASGFGITQSAKLPDNLPASQPAVSPSSQTTQTFSGWIDDSTGTSGATADATKLAGSPAASKKGIAPTDVQPLTGLALSEGEGRHARAKLSSGEMIVAEYATTAGVSSGAIRRLLDKRGLTLDESPAAKLTLLNAVHNAAAGSASAGSAFGGRASADDISAGPATSLKLSSSQTYTGGVSVNGGTVTIQSGGTTRIAATSGASSLPRDDIGKALAHADKKDKTLESNRSLQTPAANEEPLEVVYVVGTRDQVTGLFDDLRAQPAQFQTVAVSVVKPGAADGRDEAAKPGSRRFSRDAKIANDAFDKNENDRELRADLRKETPSPLAAPSAPPLAPLAPAAASAGKTADQQVPAQIEALDDESGTKIGPAAAAPVPSAAASRAAKKRTAEQPDASKQADTKLADGEPPVVEQKAIDSPAAPSKTDVPAAADFKSQKASIEPSSSASWAAQMTQLPPETENILRRTLTDRRNPPADLNRPVERQKSRTAAGSDSKLSQEKDADKDTYDDYRVPLKADAGKGRGASPSDREGAGDRMQAVLVFRLAPGNSSTTAAGGPQPVASPATVSPPAAPAAPVPPPVSEKAPK